ncbi:AraC family transcriptional regulator [Rheinheimera maricola]|uniref:AraC family transcriptional regulator n=1 Tax=Rheinheimera maricola TaxID=2793282 RepID=A0ABS7X8F9_9GAMM|nr:AraC family transcriptional regulator [Rheinheimera maricola]MBZ9611450.1 AraC family transcriptional regulator [Rheinheimera maricola]
MPANTAMPVPSGYPQIVLPNHYLQQLLALVKSRGVNTPALLQQAGLNQQLMAQHEIRVNWPQFYQLLQHSVALSNEPALGLYLGSQLSISTHGLLGLVALSSTDVQQALQLIGRFIATRTPLISLQVQQRRQQVALLLNELYPLGAIGPFMAETVLVALHQVLQVLTQQQYQPSQIHFAFPPPAYHALYQVFFPCKVLFSQAQTAIYFGRRFLAITPPMSDSSVQQQLSAQCEQQLQQLQQWQTLSGAIQLLLGRTKGRIPDIKQVAAEFAMSERTLRRRLGDEQISYQQLVSRWRMQMAGHYLHNTALPVQQIAYLLGYADPANFGRAFRQQHGVSPQKIRQLGVSAQVNANPTANPAHE